VLVISADPYNRSEIATVTVVVLTTNQRLASLPGNVAVPTDATRLPNDSVINVTSVATIDRNALEEHVGTLPEWAVERVDQGLSRALGLGRGRIPTR
jgi:mRNA interferase MazF